MRLFLLAQNMEVVPTLIPFVLVIFVIALGVVLLNFQFRKNLFKKQIEQEELKQQHQQKLLENTVTIQEEERRRIAQDIHDELGAVLSISKMRLSQIETTQNDQANELEVVRNHLEMALNSTRRISRELMPIQLEQLGLRRALLSLAHSADKTVVIDFNRHFADDLLTKTQQLGLYRIFSELINNTLKYAEASAIYIEIQRQEKDLTATYKDNGKGILKEEMIEGIGMQSINNRVAYLQGTWHYGDQPEGGFIAEFLLPIENQTIQN